MKRKMKLLLADIFIGALTLIFGCPLWWIGIIDLLKVKLLRLPLPVRHVAYKNKVSLKSQKTFWNESKRKGEQLI